MRESSFVGNRLAAYNFTGKFVDHATFQSVLKIGNPLPNGWSNKFLGSEIYSKTKNTNRTFIAKQN
jgi:hypothetical protein